MKNLRLFIHYFKFNLSANMAYKASFLTQVFGMMLNNSAFIIFWLILYTHIGDSLNGYQFNDVMFLWALTAFGHGIAVTFLGNNSQISRIIYSGELDVYLLQPKAVLPNMLASRMVISGWGDMIYGAILYIISQPIIPSKILLFLIFSILAALVFVAMRVFYHSFTFFFGNAESFAQTSSEMVLNFMLYPGSIFKGNIVWVLHTLFPAAIIAYIPVKLFKEFNFKTLFFLIGADTLFILIAVITFNIGIRVYESGNRMNTRL